MTGRFFPLLAGLMLALAGATPATAAAEPGGTAQAVLKAKPAVVLVRTETSASVRLACPRSAPRRVVPAPQRAHGSGYLLSPDGYVATNGHVVEPYQRDDDRELRQDFIRQAVEEACLEPGLPAERRAAALKQLYPAVAAGAAVELTKTLTVVLANREQFEAEVRAYSPAPGGSRGRVSSASGELMQAGKDVAILKIEGRNLPILRQADSDRVRVGDPIAILGFPAVVMQHSFLDQRTALEVSATSGVVSSLKRDASGTPLIQTDAAASWGNSGGPAVNARGEVVGMMTFVSLTEDQTQAVQGFNFLVPSNVVKTFARAAGAPVDEAPAGPFTAVWDEALDRMARRDAAGALARLDAANRLVPNLPDVQRLQTEAQLLLLQADSRPGRALAGGVAVAGLAMAGGAWVLLRRRRRSRSAPASPRPGRYAAPPPAPVRLPVADVARALAERLPLTLVDVRAADSRARSGVQARGAVWADAEHVVPACADQAQDHAILLYCDSPHEETSLRAARELLQAGHTRVAVLAGGFTGWQQAGLPLERTREVSAAPRQSLPLPAPPPPSELARQGDFPVGVKGRGPYFSARATAIKTTGLTLRTTQQLAPGESVRVTVFLNGDTLELSGRAAGDAATGEVAVVFDALSDEAAAMLEGFILAHRAPGAA
jgi:S1-C subfamily serine protease/rhodanese-related sulfurtransferase